MVEKIEIKIHRQRGQAWHSVYDINYDNLFENPSLKVVVNCLKPQRTRPTHATWRATKSLTNSVVGT